MDAPYTESESFRAATNLCRRITERDGGEHDRLDTDIMDWLMREPDRLAAKDAEIERLNKWVSDYGDASRKGHLRKDAEIERLTLQLTTGVEQVRAMISEEERVQMVLRDVRRKDKSEAEVALAAAVVTERERCARVAEEEIYGWQIADAIRAG